MSDIRDAAFDAKPSQHGPVKHGYACLTGKGLDESRASV
jgi:hypothetical protein